MPFVRRLQTTALLIVVWGVVSAPAAWAQARPGPEATQHALDELANCRAQRRSECPTQTATPLPTLTATPTLAPTWTPGPADTATPSPTALPALPTAIEATAAYVRPSSHPDTGAALELALPQGRWDVQTDCGDSLAAWIDVRLLGAVLHAPDDAWLCGVASSVWVSDAPCAAGDNGECAVEMDGGFWDWLAMQQPADPPTLEPTALPTSAPRAPTPRAAAPAAAGVQVQRVVQTVVSVQTVIVLVTPETSATSTPRPTAMRSPSPTATRTPSPSASPTLLPIARPTSAPPSADTFPNRARALVNDSNRLWVFGLLFGAAGVGGAWFWFTRGRRRYVL